MTHINRRKALAVVAAVPAAAALGPTFTVSGDGGQLAALVRRYLAEWDAFSAFVSEDERTDEQAEAFAARTFEATRDQIVNVPALTQEDAIAAVDWLEHESEKLWINVDEVGESLFRAIRGYLEGRVA